MSIWPKGERRAKQRYVHRLVCETFVGPEPFPGALVRHLDGDRLNNLADNLAWGTHADNTADAKGHGTLRGGGMKLDVEKVRMIRASLAAPDRETYEQIGARHGVTGSCVYAINKGISWGWLV